jgi:ABC-2 type transport system ATP-binding protein
LIILVEPFSGLDTLNANLIKDEIYYLAKKGATIIFSTHRMEQVEEICDHIVLVNLGKKILDGTVKDIKQQFKENIFMVKSSNEECIKDNDIYTVVRRENEQVLVKINAGYSTNQVLTQLIKDQVNIESYNELLPSLNDIFIKLVESTHATTRAFQNS